MSVAGDALSDLGRIDIFFFDFDGVLAESVDVKTQAFSALYRDHGPQIQEKVVAYHLANGGLPRYDKFRVYEVEYLGRSSVSDARMEALDRAFSALVEKGVTEAAAVDGAVRSLEMLVQLDRPACVVSATPQKELDRIVTARGWREYFTQVCGSPEKKAAHIARVLAERGVAPDRAIMVGDASADYEAARATGVHFLGRVPAGRASPFPSSVHAMADLAPLAQALSGLARS